MLHEYKLFFMQNQTMNFCWNIFIKFKIIQTFIKNIWIFCCYFRWFCSATTGNFTEKFFWITFLLFKVDTSNSSCGGLDNIQFSYFDIKVIPIILSGYSFRVIWWSEPNLDSMFMIFHPILFPNNKRFVFGTKCAPKLSPR